MHETPITFLDAADFTGGQTFDGSRWNDCHHTNKAKQAARAAAKKEKP